PNFKYELYEQASLILRTEYLFEALREPIEQIFERLKEFYEKAEAKGIQPVSVTIPSESSLYHFSVDRDVQALMYSTRPQINKLIKDYSEQNGMPCVDLHTATTDPQTGLMRAELSKRDGLHFNNEGYQLMAGIVFEQGIVPLMERGM
ncbi:MAG: GDSL-type esterase/lipase family protein, partial [Nanoarchaeota archaeon]